MQAPNVTRIWLALAATSLVWSCAGQVNEPFEAVTVGLPGTPCDTAAQSVGCLLRPNGTWNRMRCDGGVWSSDGQCPAGVKCNVVAATATVCGDIPSSDATPTQDGAAASSDSGGDLNDGGAGAADAGLSDTGMLDAAFADAGTMDTGGTVEDTGTAALDSGASDVSGPICGNKQCEPGENAISCAVDCDTPAEVCGDGVCAALEVIPTCAIDCDPMAKQIWSCAASSCPGQRTACAVKSSCKAAWQTTMLCLKVCGYKASCVAVCQKEMNPSPEAKTLGACALPGCLSTGGTCGDGTCGATESAQSCPADCAGGGASCGDGVCQATESAQSCPADCAKTAVCGDETCSGSESAQACPLDCEADAGKAWSCMQSHCASEKAACQADTGCLKALNDAAICLKKCGSGSSCAQQCQGPVVGNSKALSLGLCALQKCQSP
ncbi:MAG: hypothetical protein KC502_09495 [Myxococcales bacterium]|nr:hypothetical protein [Myxococcales bacterium]